MLMLLVVARVVIQSDVDAAKKLFAAHHSVLVNYLATIANFIDMSWQKNSVYFNLYMFKMLHNTFKC